jgi:hypothetical protein
MWATPDGTRRLVAASQDAAAFVSAVYRFDEVVVDPAFSARLTGRRLAVAAPDVGLKMVARAGRGWPVPLPGSAWMTRYLAGPVARRALGVRTYGVSPTGVREWYRARWYRPLVEAAAWVDGRDLGALAPLDPPVRFGFSEPPRRPSMVWVRPLLQDPAGRLAAVVPAADRRAGPAPTPPPPPPPSRRPRYWPGRVGESH